MSLVKIKCMQTTSDDDSPTSILLIPNHLLCQWYDKKPASLVQALNSNLSEMVVRAGTDTEERLRRRVSKTYIKIQKAYKWKRKELKEMSSEYMLYKNDIVKPCALQEENDQLHSEIEELKYELL